MKKWLLIILMAAFGSIKAQDKIPVTESDYSNTEVPMADKLREEGKIYVVAGIILIILVGTLGYLITIDRKVSKLEKTLDPKS